MVRSGLFDLFSDSTGLKFDYLKGLRVLIDSDLEYIKAGWELGGGQVIFLSGRSLFFQYHAAIGVDQVKGNGGVGWLCCGDDMQVF